LQLTKTIPDENRLHLLEANVIQILLSLLEAYNEKVQPCGLRTQLTIFEFKLIRTILGALLNASLDCGMNNSVGGQVRQC